jgi:hypothetical protein
MPRWIARVSVHSPIEAATIRVRDRSGVDFTSARPADVKVAATFPDTNLLLLTSLDAADPASAVQTLDPIINRVLNMLSFRLLVEMESRGLEVIEDRPASETRRGTIMPGYSPLGRGRFQWIGFVSEGAIPQDLAADQDDAVDTALSWFRRGASAGNPVEAFGAYWLSLEALAPSGPEASLRMRCCGHTIANCPSCGTSTAGPVGMRNRLKHWFLSSLAGSEADFERFWEFRNDVFHGSGSVFARMLELATAAPQLRAVCVRALKQSLGIDAQLPPHQGADGYVIGQVGLTITIPPVV